jgi:hypothetical protein
VGSNATFGMWYESDAESSDNSEQNFYIFADVTFVELSSFTEEDPDISTDSSVNVTTMSAGSDSSESLTASQLASHVASAEGLDTTGHRGLTKGDIAGIVFGSVAGAALIGAVGFYLIRYQHARQEGQRAKHAAATKFDIELANRESTSQTTRSRDAAKQLEYHNVSDLLMMTCSLARRKDL